MTAKFHEDKINKISTKQGQRLSHTTSQTNFKGYTKLSEGAKNALEAAGTFASVAGVTSTVSSGALIFSSLFGNSLSFLSKMIQIMEFTAIMQYYNIEYDQMLARVLQFISKATEVNLLDINTGEMYGSLEHSEAGIYKGALTDNNFKPYILQNMGYLGLLLLLLYTVHFIMLAFSTRKIRVLETLRYTLFSSLFIDYLGFLFRTLGHHPFRTSSDFGSNLSFAFAIYTLICLNYEIIDLLIKARDLHKIEESRRTLLESSFAGYIYDGMNKDMLATSFFARNFNLLYLLRF